MERLIIKWALKRLRKSLPTLRLMTYEGLAKWGIGDLMENPHTKELAIYIDPDL